MKATKDEILEYMFRRGVTVALDLMNNFGYTEGGAWCRLTKLKHFGLIINDRRGEWVVTDYGVKRIRWHRRKRRLNKK